MLVNCKVEGCPYNVKEFGMCGNMNVGINMNGQCLEIFDDKGRPRQFIEPASPGTIYMEEWNPPEEKEPARTSNENLGEEEKDEEL